MDELAIQVFLANAYPRIVAMVTLVCDSEPAAEDAVQEALVRAWEHKGELENPDAWITTVSFNLARSGLRRRWVEQRARRRLLPVPPSEPSADAVDVRRALALLTRRQREVTVLRYYGGLDVTEIASTLAITEGTVKTLLFRSRDVLASALGHQEEVTNAGV
jgi:RNA polymerase sigma-70 factor, ECF subfamily